MNSYVISAKYSDDIIQQPSHYHDCCQIVFIKKGNISVTINGKVQAASKGDLIIINRFENHSVKIEGSEYERYILRIYNAYADDKIFSLFTNRPENFNNIISAKPMYMLFAGLMQKIVSEFNRNDNYSTELQNLLLNEMILYICRLLPEEITIFKFNEYDYISALKKELENNFAERHSLQALSDKYNISISALSHTFKKVVGVSVFEYLLFCRIAAAKNYLVKTDFSIGEIVEKCGFSDASNFSRAFKRLNEISPSDFRKKYRL